MIPIFRYVPIEREFIEKIRLRIENLFATYPEIISSDFEPELFSFSTYILNVAFNKYVQTVRYITYMRNPWRYLNPLVRTAKQVWVALVECFGPSDRQKRIKCRVWKQI